MQWAFIEPHCLGKFTDLGQIGRDPRVFVGAVLWIVRTRVQWRVLTVEFGKGSSVLRRFRRWVKADAFHRMFKELSSVADLECAMIYGTIEKARRSGQDANGRLFTKPPDVLVAV